MWIGKKEYDFQRHTYIMGILNVTPDSFSDGGKFQSVELALKQAEQMVKDGADIIDVGGESTRPGYTRISEEEEIDRVAAVIEGIKSRLDITVSLDTYKSKVAKAGIEAGADLINDIWGCRQDVDMAKVIADTKVACCLMHNRNVEEHPYQSFMEDVVKDLQESVCIAKRAGIQEEKIILDPGIGFGKNLEQNLLVMKQLEQIVELGFPVLLGASRKSMIGNTLQLPVEQRLEGTLATTVLGVMKGCRLLRVHDVLENKRAITMTEAILNSI